MKIGVQNLSTLVSGEDAYIMAMLVDKQLREHAAPAWGLLPPAVAYLGTGIRGTPYQNAIIGILDDADQAGDLGWHTEGPDADVYGRVFARPVLGNGGSALGPVGLTVCSVLSHECLETLLDPACDLWAQAADGTLYARELGDPVESDSYLIEITASDTSSVMSTVSDFVLPSWFDPDAASGQTDYMGLTTAPFEVRSTGYVIVMQDGVISSQWGDEYPEWRKATKLTPAARTARRLQRGS
jgi:hypothetical protein